MDNKKSLAYFIPFVLLVVVIAEAIGFRKVQVGRFTLNILPLVFAVLIAMVLALPILDAVF